MLCKYENWQGDCKLSNFPDGWICPPDRVYCNECGEYFRDGELIGGLCAECKDEKQ